MQEGYICKLNLKIQAFVKPAFMHPNAFTIRIVRSSANRFGFVKILRIGPRYRWLKTRRSIPRSDRLNLQSPASKWFPEGWKGCVLTVKTELHVYFQQLKEAFGIVKHTANKCLPVRESFPAWIYALFQQPIDETGQPDAPTFCRFFAKQGMSVTGN